MTSENTAGSHLPIVGLPTSSDPLSNPSNPVWPSIPSRGRARAIAIGAAATTIALLTLVLPYGSAGAALLLDRQPYSIFPYPFTIQNITYILLAWSLADLFVRWRMTQRERAFLNAGFLPEDSTTMLEIHELGPIRIRVAPLHDAESGFLPALLDMTILQFQASKSVDQSMTILTNALSLMGDRVDLRYQMLRYMAWLIPTIGFLGTVIGLSLALHLIDPKNMDLGRVVGGLSVSFYTTLVALLASAVLAFAQHSVQEQEELALNAAGQYCLANLINRVYIDQEKPGAMS
ncbi:MotA/TolQ/ExbB proton channel family protein [Rhodopseudomonas boonkerdii]|uniref:MotA/TolQ/ExbB proton channel family protein n=1 Tax=Rhodopseudomonas boonkerdii TaxID=475937 RepID=UPI001E51D133|nr:MotA/TolQ/ExbB proton channel family protein [Rhodopseudomonas boonkerdii]UGV24968.1 MotA/TolQ/ExbB proton channel family protein [Rhodopseudomonas boonkerdii]